MSRARILFLGAILAVLSFIILNAPAGAKDEQAGEAVKMYFAAKDDDQRAYILKVIKRSGASLDDLAAALPDRREFEKPETENNVCSHKFENNDEAVFYVPDTYDGKEPFGLIIHLFGAGGNGDVGAYRWSKTAGKEDYIILTPYRPAGNIRGRTVGESRWWQDDVAKFVKECLDFTLEAFNIDPDRVYVSGFSNGAHGVWSIAGFWPDRIAAATAQCGTPAIQYNYGFPMYIVNMRHVALDLRMGGQDRMDWKTVQRCAELLNEMDGEANFKLEENRQHRWMTDKAPEILEWFGKTRRVLYPKHVSLRTREEEFGKSYWVRIDEIGDCKNNAEFEKDWSREATGQKGVKMGFYRDDQYTGEGVQVGRLVPDSPAAKCGLEAGDIIYRVGGHDVIKWEDLGEALSNFKIGDETTVMVERKGEDTELKIKFTEVKIPQQPGRPELKPFPYDSARVEARIGRSNKISLKVAKVKRLTLFLHPDMGLDLSEPVKIMVNDNEVFSGLVKENAETLLEHARVFIDTKRVFTATIAIDVKSGKGKALTGIKAPGSAKKADKPEEKKPEKKEPVEKEPVKKEKPVEKKPVEKKEPKKEEKKEDKKWR